MKRRAHRPSPPGTHFVGYSALSDYDDKAKRRHHWNKLKREHAMNQISPKAPPPDSQPVRSHYLFQLRHYETNEHALAAATMFAVWTMARGDYLGLEGNEFFIQVTANGREVYSDFIESLYDQFRAQGVITPKKPPELQELEKNGLNIPELLSKYPPLPAPPM
jgi:hypothetical protein